MKVSLLCRYDVAAFCERDIYGRKSNAGAAVIDQAKQALGVCAPQLHG